MRLSAHVGSALRSHVIDTRKFAYLLLVSVIALCAWIASTPAEALGATRNEDLRIQNPEPSPTDWFGQAVAVDGDTMIVGTPFDDTMGDAAGIAHVWRRSGKAWSIEATLTASDGAAPHGFGKAIALDGDTAVIGASGRNGSRGAGYVFTRIGTTWTEQQILTASDGYFNDNLGSSCAIENGTIALSAVGDDDHGDLAGAVYIFTRHGNTWTERTKIFPDVHQAGARFGYSIDLSGDTLVSGATYKDTVGTANGAVYVFAGEGAWWSQEATLTAEADTDDYDLFGWDVSIHNDTVVVGLPHHDEPGLPYAGVAYAFKRTGTTWAREARLLSPELRWYDFFGYGVDVHDDRILIGAPSGTTVSGEHNGKGWVYERTGSTWNYTDKLLASDGVIDDQLGRVVALSGDTAVASAIGVGDAVGAAYVYDYGWPEYDHEPVVPSVVTTAADLQRFPAISGDVVVWEDNRDAAVSSTDVYMMDLESGSVASLSTAPYAQIRPDVYGHRVVWSHQLSGGDRDIHLFDLLTLNESAISTATGAQMTPSISADRAVWTDSRGADADIWGYDFGTAAESAIATDTGDQIGATVGDSEVAWQDFSDILYDVDVLDLTTSARTSIANADGDVFDPHLDGERLSWVNDNWIGDETFSAHTVDRSTGTTLTVPTADPGEIVGYRDFVVYTDWTYGDADIYLFNTLTSETWPICTAPGNQNHPDIDGNRIVWDDERPGAAGGSDIHMAEFDFWAPVTTSDAAASYPGTATVALSPVDDEPWYGGLGVESTFYRVDGGAETTYTAAFEVSGEGTHTIEYRSIDLAHNIEATQTTTFEIRSTPTTLTEDLKLQSTEPTANDWFGISVAVDGDTMVVGESEDDTLNTNSGMAHVYRYTGTAWSHEATLTASDAGFAWGFGKSVDIDGDTILIGATGHNGSRGAGYVFTRTGSTWTEEQILTASDGYFNDYLGRDSAIDGDTIVLGASGDDDYGSASGAAYVFTKDVNGWFQRTKLFPSVLTPSAQFGRAVDVSGDTIVAAAPYIDIGGSSGNGAAYVFTGSVASWTQEATLTAESDASDDDHLGWVVGIDGDTIVAGAPYEDEPGLSNVGAAYVFTRTDSVWSRQARLQSPEMVAFDAYSYAVGIRGDRIAIGAPSAGVAGQGWVYKRTGESWALVNKLLASDGASPIDQLGISVSVSAETVLMGALGVDQSAGAAYAYDYGWESITEADHTAPVTTDNAPTVWARSPIDVTLTATDAGSGVDHTLYSLNGSAMATYTVPVAVSLEGTNTLEYRSVDVLGNAEDTRTATIRIDDTPPSTASDAQASYVDTATITLSPTDALSGIASTVWRVDGGAWNAGVDVEVTTGGNHLLEWNSADVAENIEATQSATFSVTDRLDQDNPGAAYREVWFTTTHPLNYYGGSLRYAKDSQARMVFVFKGTAIDLVALRASNMGIMDVAIDGAPATPVDLYAPFSVYQGTVWSVTGLVDTTHTITATRTGLKNPSATGDQINVDAFDVVGVPVTDDMPPVTTSDAAPVYATPPHITLDATDDNSFVAETLWRLNGGAWQSGTTIDVDTGGTHLLEWYSTDAVGNVEATQSATFDYVIRHDQEDPLILREGTWFETTHPTNYYAGSLRYAKSSPAETTFAFSGTGFDIIALKAPNMGYAEVTIDGTSSAQVDLYSPASLYKQVAWGVRGLDDTTHTVTFSYTGSKNASATDTQVNIDAVDVVGELAVKSARYQEDDALLLQEGAWYTTTHPTYYSGGALRYAKTDGAQITFAFRGTGADLVGIRQSNMGIAEVSLDGSATTQADLYSAATQYRQVLWSVSGLEDTTHSVTFAYTGDKNPAATGAQVNLDAIDVTGELVDDYVSLDNQPPVTDSDLQPTYYETATVTFTPTDSLSGPAATVWSLDGGAWTTGTVATVPYAPGTHSLDWYSVDVAGNVETTRSATFDMMVRYNEDDASVVNTGTWYTTTHAVNYYATTLGYAKSLPASMEFSFYGSGIDLVAMQASNMGIASLTLDGGASIDVDLYSASPAYRQVVWSARGLAETTHTVTFSYTGTKNSAASDAQINVDAMDVMPPLE